MEENKDARTTFETKNPATNEVEQTYHPLSDEQIKQIVEEAHEAFGQWKQTSFCQRACLLNKVASLMREQKDKLARLCSKEMGKLLKEGIGEVELCASICEYYAKNGEKFLQDKPLETEHGKAFISYEPIGVILSIQPWNFPFYQIIRAAAPHIMAGNTFLLKHSHNVPQCALAMEEIFRDAGFPKGVYTNLFLGEGQAASLIANRYVRGVTFTGSEAAGSKVAQSASQWAKKCVLELGGSDPLIILDDVDNLDEVLEIAVKERLSNAGQVCTSPKRFIVMQSVANECIEKVKGIIEKIKVGDPLDDDTELGPLVNEDARDKVLSQIEKSVSNGTRIIYGGKKLDRQGAYMEPTVITHIMPGTVAYQEEIFGPVVSIFPVDNEEEAIKLANDTAYGLGATIFTQDEERGVRVARQIESGMVFINHVTTSAPELPFGGIKNSGYGRELSKEGIKEFVNKKLIRISSMDADY